MRAIYLRDGFPTHRVHASEHQEELILPEFAEIYDEAQKHPITETCQWIDAVYDVNAHHEPGSRLGNVAVARLCLPPTPRFGITEIRRTDYDNRTKVYQLIAQPKSLNNRDHAVLEIIHHPITTHFSFDGKEIFRGQAAEEHTARELVQPCVQYLLEDLGYGNPHEFSGKAVDLVDYRAAQGIVWPRPFTLTLKNAVQTSVSELPRTLA